MAETLTDAALRRSGVLVAQERWLDAIQQLEPALAENPSDPRLWGRLALAQANLPDHLEDSLASAERAVSLSGGDAEALRILAAVQALKGAVRPALAACRKAVAADPKNARLHATLADLLAKSGKPAEAAASARRAVELAPMDPSYRVGLAEILLTWFGGDSAALLEAKEQIDLARELDSGASDNLSAQAAQALHGCRLRQTPEVMAADTRLSRWATSTSRSMLLILLLEVGLLAATGRSPMLSVMALACTGWLVLVAAMAVGWHNLGRRARSDFRVLARSNVVLACRRVTPVVLAWLAPMAVLPLANLVAPLLS